MRHLILLFIIFSTPLVTKAQLTLDSIMIIPPNPATSDFIRVVKPVATSYGELVSNSSWNNGSSQVIINACYFAGMTTAPMTHFDTVDVGYLPAGSYNLNYVTDYSSLIASCTYDYSFNHSTTFEVVDDLSVSDLQVSDVSVYPNPSSGSIYIDGLEEHELVLIELLDVNGRLISTKSPSMHLFFNVQKGSYLIRITTQNEEAIVRRIVVI